MDGTDLPLIDMRRSMPQGTGSRAGPVIDDEACNCIFSSVLLEYKDDSNEGMLKLWRVR
jgi:hypothetical protein